jgi:hypothetical protein
MSGSLGLRPTSANLKSRKLIIITSHSSRATALTTEAMRGQGWRNGARRVGA